MKIVDFPLENGGSVHSYVSHYQRVIIQNTISVGPCPSLPESPSCRRLQIAWRKPLGPVF